MSVDISSLKEIEKLLDRVDKKETELQSLKAEMDSLEGILESKEFQAKENALNEVRNELVKKANANEIKNISKQATEYKKTLYSSVSKAVSEYLNSSDFTRYLELLLAKIPEAKIESDSKYKTLLPVNSVIHKEKEGVLRFWIGDLTYDLTPFKLHKELVRKIIIKNLAK